MQSYLSRMTYTLPTLKLNDIAIFGIQTRWAYVGFQLAPFPVRSPPDWDWYSVSAYSILRSNLVSSLPHFRMSSVAARTTRNPVRKDLWLKNTRHWPRTKVPRTWKSRNCWKTKNERWRGYDLWRRRRPELPTVFILFFCILNFLPRFRLSECKKCEFPFRGPTFFSYPFCLS